MATILSGAAYSKPGEGDGGGREETTGRETTAFCALS